MGGKKEVINCRIPLLIACLKINLFPMKKTTLYTYTSLRHPSHCVEHLFTRRRVRESDLGVLVHFHTVASAHKVYWNPHPCNLQDRLQIWAPWANA